MKKILLLVLVIGAIVFTISKIGPQGERVDQTHDRSETPIKITVYFYPNNSAVTTEYRIRHNIPRTNPFPGVEGFAIWPEWIGEDGNRIEKTDELECEIHSVRPKTVDDNATLTLGHELLHCLYGSYHAGHYR